MISGLNRIIQIRKILHSNPQLGFQQFNTQKIIMEQLLLIGIPLEQIKKIAITGVLVDLKGDGPNNGSPRCIAFRADIDALNVGQLNTHLQYKSKVEGIGHMCGHDGHTAWLLGFANKFMENRKLIPRNKTFRLLFQPSQQGPQSGAKKMIQQGCLIGVDQIYGIHNLPLKHTLNIFIKSGPVMSESTTIKIRIKGVGGHGSQPDKVKNSLKAGVNFYINYNKYIDQLKQKGANFVSTLPLLKAGQRYNAFSDDCVIEGTIRSYQKNLSNIITNKISEFLKQIESEGFKIQSSFHRFAPININTEKQTENVIRVGQKIFGKGKIGKGVLPSNSSEDFAYYTQKIPGAYFFIITTKENGIPLCHSNKFDFNDEQIPTGIEVWWQLALDRSFNQ